MSDTQKGLRMEGSKFVAEMLAAGCYFDTEDPRKLIIPEDVAAKAGVLPGYFYAYEPIDGVAKVEKFGMDGKLERLQ